MCGIAGYFGLTGGPAVPAGVLQCMVSTLEHRGPDAGGVFEETREETREEMLEAGPVGLGHRRLSIVDLSGGHQPLASADGRIRVSFNGEIFNYVELRRALAARGFDFRTHSDTETIVAAYAEEGPACVERFNGDFAYALWDRDRRRLVLARDRMGVRPLYYTVVGGTLVFASEVKALLQFPGVRAELDPIALDQVFTFWFPLSPRTPYKGICELPPGHQLIAERGRYTVAPYWRLEFPDREALRADDRTEAQVAEELEALLTDATRIRLRADVPVGAYLSGGFDSSATTALARRLTDGRLRTFSVAFESADYDESAYQREVVRALGTEHSEVLATGADIARSFPEVVRHTERPILRTAPAPLYLLARLVREHAFKVVMTGEGADEVFGGYDIFKEAAVRRFWSRSPRSRWRPALLGRLYPWLGSMQSQSPEFLQAFFRNGLERTDDPLYSHLPRFLVARRAGRFLSGDVRSALQGYDPLEELRAALPPDYGRWHPLSQAQYLEAAHLLPGYILSSQGDRVAMAHGVEGRFPFLDHRVVEFAARIPPRMKLKGLREKHILREALGRYVPASVERRAKQPYRAPESECFFGAAAPDYVGALLSSESIARSGYFEPRAVDKLVAKCRSGGAVGTADNMALVGILSTQLLDAAFVSRRAPQEAREPARAVAGSVV